MVDIERLKNLYALIARMESVVATIDAMHAGNKEREAAAMFMAYGEDDFREAQIKLEEISEELKKI